MKAPSKPKASSNDKERSGDYAIFPPLEKEVKDTLIASDPSITSNGELPEEIYARIGFVHGFPRFNYLSSSSFDDGLEIEDTTDSSSESLSFSDLLGTPSNNSLLSSSSSNISLSDISSSSSKMKQIMDITDISSNPDDVTVHANILDSVSKIPAFDQFRILHIDPLIIAIDNFFTDEECDRYISMSEETTASTDGGSVMTRSRTVGKDANAKAQRTSTTWFHPYKNVPELMAKCARLFGVENISQFEEPQTVRYRRSEKFTWHLDAFAPGSNNMDNGGQRTATFLVYLTEVSPESGGATTFRDLGRNDEPLKVQPKRGTALLFFPAAGGIPNTPFDIRTLHAGEEVSSTAQNDKWIAQLWLREKTYSPNVPPGNSQNEATSSIKEYCNSL